MIEQSISLFFSNHGISPDGESYRSYIFNCPACGGKKKLYIEKTTGRTKCFKSDSEHCPSGKLTYALHLITGLPTSLISTEIFEATPPLKHGDEVDISFEVESTQKKHIAIPASGDDIPIDFIPIYDPEAIEGVNYLEKRGITREMMVKYGFMYSPIMRRVIFPVVMDSVLYGWQGRAVDQVDKNLRMYNMPGEWKARTLMFYGNIKNSKHVILAEGPISALKFEKVGGFVASMGKEISLRQIEIIMESGVEKLYLALDRDAAENINSIVEKVRNPLAKKLECFIINIPDHRGDFGDCTYDECEKAFKNANPITPDDIFVYMDPKQIIRTKK